MATEDGREAKVPPAIEALPKPILRPRLPLWPIADGPKLAQKQHRGTVFARGTKLTFKLNLSKTF